MRPNIGYTGRTMNRLFPFLACFAMIFISASPSRADQPHQEMKSIRIGIIGLDTSHVVAFTKLLNDPKASGELAGIRVVAAFPGGSADMPASHDRVQKFTQQVRDMGVHIVDSIPALLPDVDVVLLESVDGRPHLEQARLVFEAKRPIFIDKPLAGSLTDAVAIAELGARHKVPWFCSSSLRFAPNLRKALSDPALGGVVGCDTWGPCPIEEHHPDLYWYGIHGVETLYTVMGPGCEWVKRTHTEGADVVTGKWKDGRLGTFRGIRQGKEDYGAIIFAKNRIVPVIGFEGYEPLVEQIARFFKSRQPPVAAAETIELYAFMEAADESKRQKGAAVAIDDVLKRAKQKASMMLDSQSPRGDR